MQLIQGDVNDMNSSGNSIKRGRIWIVAGLAAAMCACLGGAIRSARAASPAPTKTIWDGVYTDDQAARGKAQYDTSCSSCHMEDLSGSGQALPLAGDAFTDVWEGQTMADLLGLVQGTMPQDKPGSLTPEAALDVISYILQYNKLPAGKEELKNDPDALKDILITKKAPAKAP
ncbi:MAG TPA: cytochrome c [Acidobacteriaceae bacterium]|jgi:mono/diheme cytochrome c family protein|nr:cytochrome c [Acidobacteriaceae bacterium]HXA79235.1 cytochrome c [Candidatus Acidoferrales bacterium]